MESNDCVLKFKGYGVNGVSFLTNSMFSFSVLNFKTLMDNEK
ncbi:hypothetical protein J2127_001053 [Methanococcus voltae]|nr:hypothetical protein [Methanococcus voltae]MBP2143884.1 hypothetical protein [Methanococcus voltae]